MKTVCIVLLVVVGVAFVQGESSEKYKALVTPLAESCKDQVKATDKDLHSVINLEKELTHEGKCLVKCTAEKVGFIKDSKLVPYKDNPDLYKSLFHDDPERLKHVDTVFDKCHTEAEKESPDDLCVAAYVSFSCFISGTV